MADYTTIASYLKDHKGLPSRSEGEWIYVYAPSVDAVMGLDALKSFMKQNGYNYHSRDKRTCYAPNDPKLYTCDAYIFEYNKSITVKDSNDMAFELIRNHKIPSANVYENFKTLIYVCQDAAQKYPGGWREFQLYMYRNGYTYLMDKQDVTCFQAVGKNSKGIYSLTNHRVCYANVFYAN